MRIYLVPTLLPKFSQRGRGVTDRGATAQKVLRGFQRSSEVFRDCQKRTEGQRPKNFKGADVHDPKGLRKNFGQKNFGLNFRSLIQRFSEIFRMRFLIWNCAEKCWEVLRTVPPSLRYPSTPLQPIPFLPTYLSHCPISYVRSLSLSLSLSRLFSAPS